MFDGCFVGFVDFLICDGYWYWVVDIKFVCLLIVIVLLQLVVYVDVLVYLGVLVVVDVEFEFGDGMIVCYCVGEFILVYWFQCVFLQ